MQYCQTCNRLAQFLLQTMSQWHVLFIFKKSAKTPWLYIFLFFVCFVQWYKKGIQKVGFSLVINVVTMPLCHNETASQWHGVTRTRRHNDTASQWHGVTMTWSHNDTASQWHGVTMTWSHNGTASQWHGITMTRRHNDTESQWHGVTMTRRHNDKESQWHDRKKISTEFFFLKSSDFLLTI